MVEKVDSVLNLSSLSNNLRNYIDFLSQGFIIWKLDALITTSSFKYFMKVKLDMKEKNLPQ